jgi:hypothetical protein
MRRAWRTRKDFLCARGKQAKWFVLSCEGDVIAPRHALRPGAPGVWACHPHLAPEWLGHLGRPGVADIPRQPAIRCQAAAANAESHARPVQSIDRDSRRTPPGLGRDEWAIAAILAAPATQPNRPPSWCDRSKTSRPLRAITQLARQKSPFFPGNRPQAANSLIGAQGVATLVRAT